MIRFDSSVPLPDQDKLLDEQLSLAVGNYLYTALGTVFTSLLLYLALRSFGDVDDMRLFGWLVSQFLLCCVWVWVYWRYKDDYQPIRALWEWWIEIPTSLWAGLNWGLMWALFISPDNLYSDFFLNTAICGIVLGLVVANPLNRLVLAVALVACLLPVIVRALWIGGFMFNWIAAVAALFMVAAYVFGLSIRALHLKTLQQREENARLAAALTMEKQQVERISQEKTRFLAAASHDLRQPIQAMRLFEGALLPLLTTPQQQHILAKISEAGNSLSRLLENLLDVSRLDSGVIPSEPVLLPLEDVLSRLYQQYADLAETRQIELRCVATREQAFIDPGHLERMLGNLLGNAIKYMGRPGKILLGVRRKGRNLRIEVHDNGQGIPAHEQDKVFEEFYQVGNPERNRRQGLGLGLPIVQRLARLTGCRVALRSEYGKGCCFTLHLPTSAAGLLPVEDRVALFPTILPLPQQRRVLVLEDEAEVAEGLATVLASWGLEVSVATNRDSARQAVQRAKPHLVVADYQLQHGENGVEVIAMLGKLFGQPLQAILLTGNSDPAVVKHLASLPWPVLHKPVQAGQLQAVVRQALHEVGD